MPISYTTKSLKTFPDWGGGGAVWPGSCPAGCRNAATFP
jgi:hypothetical protein